MLCALTTPQDTSLSILSMFCSHLSHSSTYSFDVVLRLSALSLRNDSDYHPLFQYQELRIFLYMSSWSNLLCLTLYFGSANTTTLDWLMVMFSFTNFFEVALLMFQSGFWEFLLCRSDPQNKVLRHGTCICMVVSVVGALSLLAVQFESGLMAFNTARFLTGFSVFGIFTKSAGEYVCITAPLYMYLSISVLASLYLPLSICVLATLYPPLSIAVLATFYCIISFLQPFFPQPLFASPSVSSVLCATSSSLCKTLCLCQPLSTRQPLSLWMSEMVARLDLCLLQCLEGCSRLCLLSSLLQAHW